MGLDASVRDRQTCAQSSIFRTRPVRLPRRPGHVPHPRKQKGAVFKISGEEFSARVGPAILNSSRLFRDFKLVLGG